MIYLHYLQRNLLYTDCIETVYLFLFFPLSFGFHNMHQSHLGRFYPDLLLKDLPISFSKNSRLSSLHLKFSPSLESRLISDDD